MTKGSQVAIIVPTYNRFQLLTRALESIEGQTFRDWHLFVVDDGSTDGTSSLRGIWSNRPQVTWLTRSNGGVSAARNEALKIHKSPYVAFLDSDDEWLPEKLEKQWNFMETHRSIPLVHAEELWLRNGQELKPKKKHKKSGGCIFKKSLKLCCVSPSTAFLRQDIFREVGFFREDFPVCEDYDLWLKITSRYPVGFLPDVLTIKHGGHGDQLSQSYKAMDYWRVLALWDLIQKDHLTDLKRTQAQAELRFKARILLRGYKKYGNRNSYGEILEKLQSVE